MPPALKAVLLAAGASSRMRGADKLLMLVEGEPLLRRQAKAMLAAGLGPVAVTLPPEATARAAVLEGLALTLLAVPDAASGLSASLRVAARWAGDAALMVAPADMPELSAEDFSAAAAGFHSARPLRATGADGTPGHPVIFPAALLPLFAGLTGDEGARAILRAHPPVLLPLPGSRALTDLDTPEDWAEWRNRERRSAASGAGGQPPDPRDI
ncbi:MAG: NTP transferase domain-containing protein [Pararhodobacter sp.]